MRGYLKDEDPAMLPPVPVLQGGEGDIHEAWKYFTWMQALDWKFLPSAGGLQDQDYMLMSNIFSIHAAIRRMQNPER